MLLQKVLYVAWVFGHIPRPMTKPAVFIHSPNPFVQESPFGLGLLRVLPLRFKNHVVSASRNVISSSDG